MSGNRKHSGPRSHHGDFSDALAEFMQRDVDCAEDVTVVVLAGLTHVQNRGLCVPMTSARSVKSATR